MESRATRMLAGGSTLQSPISECAGSIPHRSFALRPHRVRADVMRSNAAPLFVRVAKVFGGCPIVPEERIIKTSILGDN